MRWTKILTREDKLHLRQNVTMLTGLQDRNAVMEQLNRCTSCPECRRLLEKIKGMA